MLGVFAKLGLISLLLFDILFELGRIIFLIPAQPDQILTIARVAGQWIRDRKRNNSLRVFNTPGLLPVNCEVLVPLPAHLADGLILYLAHLDRAVKSAQVLFVDFGHEALHRVRNIALAAGFLAH